MLFGGFPAQVYFYYYMIKKIDSKKIELLNSSKFKTLIMNFTV